MRPLDQFIHPPQRVLAAASRAEPAAVLREVPLEDRLDHVHDRRLHHAIPHRGDAQRSRLGRARLGDVHASDGLGNIRADLQRVRQLPGFFRELPLELSDRHVVHPGRAVVARDLLERRQQVPLGEDLIKQPKPLASFHPLFEGRQHADGPDARFGPSPARSDLFGLLSRRHSRRSVFRSSGHRASISLEPFAPPALPGFDAPMAPLTPARRALRIASIVNTRLALAGLSVSCARPSDHSASDHHPGPCIALTRDPSACKTSDCCRFGLRRLPAGSPHGQAESSSLALRTGRSPPVAPHPASRRRSFLQLQDGARLPGEDFHLSDQSHLQTHWPRWLVNRGGAAARDYTTPPRDRSSLRDPGW
jgi:hypothetical protein